MRIGTVVASRAGIFFGWWVVFASAAIVFLTGGTFFYGFSALFNPIVKEFGWSYTQISFAASLRGLEVILLAPVAGFLVEHNAARQNSGDLLEHDRVPFAFHGHEVLFVVLR